MDANNNKCVHITLFSKPAQCLRWVNNDDINDGRDESAANVYDSINKSPQPNTSVKPIDSYSFTQMGLHASIQSQITRPSKGMSLATNGNIDASQSTGLSSSSTDRICPLGPINQRKAKSNQFEWTPLIVSCTSTLVCQANKLAYSLREDIKM